MPLIRVTLMKEEGVRMPKIRQPQQPAEPEEDASRPERRARRQTLIEEIIAEHLVTTQARLQELLEQQGLQVTQSSISRDLRDLGVRGEKGVYILRRRKEAREWSLESAIGLVETAIRSGANLTVLRTIPRAA